MCVSVCVYACLCLCVYACLCVCGVERGWAGVLAMHAIMSLGSTNIILVYKVIGCMSCSVGACHVWYVHPLQCAKPNGSGQSSKSVSCSSAM